MWPCLGWGHIINWTVINYLFCFLNSYMSPLSYHNWASDRACMGNPFQISNPWHLIKVLGMYSVRPRLCQWVFLQVVYPPIMWQLVNYDCSQCSYWCVTTVVTLSSWTGSYLCLGSWQPWVLCWICWVMLHPLEVSSTVLTNLWYDYKPPVQMHIIIASCIGV